MTMERGNSMLSKEFFQQSMLLSSLLKCSSLNYSSKFTYHKIYSGENNVTDLISGYRLEG
jgi:hypothetical protein